MCGRIACAFGPEELSYATACKSKQDYDFIKTNIHQSSLNFNPSYNVPPTASVPVIISAQHKQFQDPKYNKETDRLLVVMRFGMIPHWLNPENVKIYKHETHLCKMERIQESKLYNPLFKKGFRCAVPCLGYYEWQSRSKQPYFFYNENNTQSDLLSSTKGLFESVNGWSGVQLLFLAGIFNIYTDTEGNPAYSFAIITRESSEEWQWVHHRTPVILQSEEDVNEWINYDSSPESAFEILQSPIENLATYPVDKAIVNKTRINMSSCIVAIELNKPKDKLMSTWLNSASGKKSNTIKGHEKTKSKVEKKRLSLDSWLASGNKKSKKE